MFAPALPFPFCVHTSSSYLRVPIQVGYDDGRSDELFVFECKVRVIRRMLPHARISHPVSTAALQRARWREAGATLHERAV